MTREKISTYKARLGFEDGDPDYDEWRRAMHAYAQTNNIRGKNDPGAAAWGPWRAAAIAHARFPGSGKRLLAQGEALASKALDEILVDITKKNKHRERVAEGRRIDRKRRRAPDDIVGLAGPDEDPQSLRADTKSIGVFLYLADPAVPEHKRQPPDGATAEQLAQYNLPQNRWVWFRPGERFIATVTRMTIQGVRDALANHLPAGRTVREIHGALVDPDATQLTHPKDSIVLSSDAEVEAFFRITESKPIKLLIVMHRKVEDGADTPPHAGSGQVHFAKNHFDPPKVYDDPATDSDSLVRTWAGFKKRRMPKKDQSFEERIMKIRRKIKQLQKVKRELKAEHKRQYPTALDSDDEGWHYLDWLRPRLDAATWVSPMARTAAQVGVDAFHACDSSGLTAIESQYAAMSSAAMALDRSAPPMRKGMVAATVQGGLNHCLTLTPALKVHDAPGRRWKEDDDEDPVE